MNVQRIHLQIDQLEDELIAQKLKSKAINDDLQEAFNDMVQIWIYAAELSYIPYNLFNYYTVRLAQVRIFVF